MIGISGDDGYYWIYNQSTGEPGGEKGIISAFRAAQELALPPESFRAGDFAVALIRVLAERGDKISLEDDFDTYDSPFAYSFSCYSGKQRFSCYSGKQRLLVWERIPDYEDWREIPWET